MFRRVLVANRGEVAARVVRSCRRLGIETVVVVSAADQQQSWLEDADRIRCIGGPHPRDSYLDADAILEVAHHERCSAVHPGWGFLAENARFAARCEALGISFVGPPFAVLHRLGHKLQARRLMASEGLAVIPGSLDPLQDERAAAAEAERLGYPLLVKAVAGGGGHGQCAARSPSDLPEAFQRAQAQATSAFGHAAVYVEKLVEGGRHVEFQLLVDRYGTALSVGERECSIQRQRQKLLEEAPAATELSQTHRAQGERAAQILARAGYQGAGTVEMLLDPGGQLFFLECNARLQVEHAVTEATCGLDLVEWQLRIAAGEPLTMQTPTTRGHALECRINAEDPRRGFRPSPGVLTRLRLPEGRGLRVDTHLRRAGAEGDADRISSHYDSLICKIIAHGSDREQAIRRMRSALRRTRIGGVRTTLPLHRALLDDPDFVAGRYDTTFLERRFLPGWQAKK